jgi:phosphopantetheine--protein transferase-like protein
MIIGIGIDSVEISRFALWHLYSDGQLSRIFSEIEIIYCRSNPAKSPERFAVRFAAREAFFKAYSTAMPHHTVPFLSMCKAVSIVKNDNGRPELIINNTIAMPKSITWISCTHTKTIATAVVVLEKK